MPLLLDTVTGHGAAVAYHKIVGARLLGGRVEIEVGSWPTEADALAGKPPVWIDRHLADVPLDLDAVLAALPAFAGATTVDDAAESLDAAKTRAWARIKAARAAAEYGGFDYGGSAYDSDAESQRRIQGAAQMATLAAAAGQSFLIDWTLADNGVVPLDGAGMIAVGMALAAHVSTCHVLGRELRAQIEVATTKDELAAINW